MGLSFSYLVSLVVSDDIKDAKFDGVILVTNGPDSVPSKLDVLKSAVSDYKQVCREGPQLYLFTKYCA